MKKLITKLAVWLIKLAYKINKRSVQKSLKKMISQSYKEMIREEFEIQREIVKVKKGNLKYYVAYFKTSTGRTKVVLKRNMIKEELFVKEIN